MLLRDVSSGSQRGLGISINGGSAAEIRRFAKIGAEEAAVHIGPRTNLVREVSRLTLDDGVIQGSRVAINSFLSAEESLQNLHLNKVRISDVVSEREP